jgi:recombination protein RecA
MPVDPDALAMIAKVNKEHGEGTVVLASDMKISKRFRTGSLSLDLALGGGLPGNQWVEVVGRESHGKTALVYKLIAACQAVDPNFTVLWIAAEHYDLDQATALGVDPDRVLVIPTQAMEFAYQQMINFAASRTVDCIVLDSYPALIPNEEAEKDMDENTMTLGARRTGQFFRKAGTATKRSLTDPDDRPILGIIINQYRDKIGARSPIPGHTPQTTPGGNAKNFAFYVRMEAKRDAVIKEKRPDQGEVAVGQTIKVTVLKNKSAPPNQVASVDFYYRDAPYLGFKRGEYDTVKELQIMGALYGAIKRKGAYLEFDGRRWGGPGRKAKDDLLQSLREEIDLRNALDAAVREAALHADELPPQDEESVERAENIGTKTVRRRKKAA